MLTILILSAAIGLIEGIPLFHKKRWKEFATVVSLIVIAISLGVAKTFDLPTPIHFLENLLAPLGKTIFKYQ